MIGKLRKNKCQENYIFKLVSDEIYIIFCIYDVLFFLFQDYFSINLYRSLFFNCKKKYIIIVLSFLLEKVIFYFEKIDKTQKNAFFFTKFFKYPFLAHKIYFLLISKCCSWNVLTNFSEWLVSLIFYQIQIEKRVNFIFEPKIKKSIWQKTFMTYSSNLTMLNYFKWKKMLWSQLIINTYTKKTFKNEQMKKNFVFEHRNLLYKNIFILYKKIELNYLQKKSLFEKIFLLKFLEPKDCFTSLRSNSNKWILMLCNIKNFYYKHIPNKTNLKSHRANVSIYVNIKIYFEMYFYLLSFIFYLFRINKSSFRNFFLLEINTLKFNLIKLKVKLFDFSIFFTRKFAVFFKRKYFCKLNLFIRLFLIHQILKITFVKKKQQIFIKSKLKNKNEIDLFSLYKKIFLNNKKFDFETILPISKFMKKIYTYVNTYKYFYFNKQGNIKIYGTI